MSENEKTVEQAVDLATLIKQDEEKRVHLCTQELLKLKYFLEQYMCRLSIVETRLDGQVVKTDIVVRPMRQ